MSRVGVGEWLRAHPHVALLLVLLFCVLYSTTTFVVGGIGGIGGSVVGFVFLLLALMTGTLYVRRGR